MKRPQNIYDASLRKLDELSHLEKKPRLLLHACCGPCASSVLVQLYDYFEITIFYSNSNIFPAQEYLRRLNELKAFLPQFNHDYHADIQLVEDDYQPKEFLKWAHLYTEDKEGGQRCHLCYEKRMRQAMQYASDHHFDYCTTVLTLSRLKNSTVINEIGRKIQKDYPDVEYFYSDFKKNKGIDLSIDLTEIYGMYRQDYCGCPYSMKKSPHKGLPQHP